MNRTKGHNANVLSGRTRGNVEYSIHSKITADFHFENLSAIFLLASLDIKKQRYLVTGS